MDLDEAKMTVRRMMATQTIQDILLNFVRGDLEADSLYDELGSLQIKSERVSLGDDAKSEPKVYL